MTINLRLGACLFACAVSQLILSRAASASDDLCPNTDAIHAKMEHALTATDGQADALVLLYKRLSDSYVRCANEWTGKDGNNEAYADYEAANWRFVQAESEIIFGDLLPARRDLDSALTYIDGAIHKFTNPEQTDIAKNLRTKMIKAHAEWTKNLQEAENREAVAVDET